MLSFCFVEYTEELVELDESGLVIYGILFTQENQGGGQLYTSRCWDYTILCSLLLYIKYKNWYHEYNSTII